MCGPWLSDEEYDAQERQALENEVTTAATDVLDEASERIATEQELESERAAERVPAYAA